MNYAESITLWEHDESGSSHADEYDSMDYAEAVTIWEHDEEDDSMNYAEARTIKGLNQKAKEAEERIQSLETRIAALEAQLEKSATKQTRQRRDRGDD